MGRCVRLGFGRIAWQQGSRVELRSKGRKIPFPCHHWEVLAVRTEVANLDICSSNHMVTLLDLLKYSSELNFVI